MSGAFAVMAVDLCYAQVVTQRPLANAEKASAPVAFGTGAVGVVLGAASVQVLVIDADGSDALPEVV